MSKETTDIEVLRTEIRELKAEVKRLCSLLTPKVKETPSKSLMTLAEAAKFTGKSRPTLRRYAEQHYLHTIEKCGRTFYQVSELSKL